ncbi:MAG: 1-acyl-sn-glycerol-3-phosphate acyltransferase [Bacteroidales bacterium]|nr:1-acyl-sn-glycerol-3-phosphate acyltransferase [Bacteroidales bacterium]
MKSDKVREQQVPMESVYPMTIKSDYTYIKTNFSYLFFSHIAYTAFHWVLGVGFFQTLGQQKTRGKEHLRPLKKQGFITVANHCHLFDTVLTGLAVLPRRPWYASVQRNFEAPYFRKMFRILRGFPIPNGPIGLRRITKPVVDAINRGNIVHFFPEAELWHLYQDIDFFQKGPFYLAHHANCPVVPIVHLFKPRKILGKVRSKNILTITSVVGEPIYPRVLTAEGQRVDLESVQEMCDTAQRWMIERMTEYHFSGKDPTSPLD